MAKKVELWQSEDGNTFKDKDIAERHEAFLKFSQWYDSKKLIRQDSRPVLADEMWEWLGMRKIKEALLKEIFR